MNLSLTSSRATQGSNAAVCLLIVATCLGILYDGGCNNDSFGFRPDMGKSGDAGSSIGKQSDDRKELHFVLGLWMEGKSDLSCEVFRVSVSERLVLRLNRVRVC